VASASLTRAARRFLSPRARWLRRAVARNGRSREKWQTSAIVFFPLRGRPSASDRRSFPATSPTNTPGRRR
jgi:hypothetical protein